MKPSVAAAILFLIPTLSFASDESRFSGIREFIDSVTQTQQQDPAPAPGWRIQQLDLKGSKIYGSCNLEPGFQTHYALRSPTPSTLIDSLFVPNKCSITIPGMDQTSMSAHVTATIDMRTNQMRLEMRIGELKFVPQTPNGGGQDTAGFKVVSIHSTGTWVMKDRISPQSVEGFCSTPKLQGVIGLRKNVVRCNLANGIGSLTAVWE